MVPTLAVLFVLNFAAFVNGRLAQTESALAMVGSEMFVVPSTDDVFEFKLGDGNFHVTKRRSRVLVGDHDRRVECSSDKRHVHVSTITSDKSDNHIRVETVRRDNSDSRVHVEAVGGDKSDNRLVIIKTR